MTYAPADLLVVRQYLVDATPLDGDAVGIVGDPEHMAGGGAHLGNDDLARIGKLSSDYTKRESPRDRPGSNAASAIDIGAWPGKAGPAGISWLAFNRALVTACERGDPRTADVREVIYTPDGIEVHRLDRLGIRSTGDKSHLFHTHISFFRDSEGRRARPDNALGLLVELIEGTDSMANINQVDWDALIWRVQALEASSETVLGGPTAGRPMLLVRDIHQLQASVVELAARPAVGAPTPEQMAALTAAIMSAIAGGVEAALRRVLGGLDGAVPPGSG